MSKIVKNYQTLSISRKFTSMNHQKIQKLCLFPFDCARGGLCEFLVHLKKQSQSSERANINETENGRGKVIVAQNGVKHDICLQEISKIAKNSTISINFAQNCPQICDFSSLLWDGQ